jgi:hypothetical protein
VFFAESSLCRDTRKKVVTGIGGAAARAMAWAALCDAQLRPGCQFISVAAMLARATNPCSAHGSRALCSYRRNPPDVAAKEGHPLPLQSLFWRSDKHEIHFVRQGKPWIEVKAGHASPFEFDWFIRTFSREKLLVVSSDRFGGSAVRGVTLEDFLLDESL